MVQRATCTASAGRTKPLKDVRGDRCLRRGFVARRRRRAGVLAWFDGSGLDVRDAADLGERTYLPLSGAPVALRFRGDGRAYALTLDRTLVDALSGRTIASDVDEAQLQVLGSGVLAAVYDANESAVELIRDCRP